MRRTTLSAVSLSCLLLAACDQDTSVSTTGPAIRYSHTPSAPCDAALGREISQQQNSLFSRATLTAARAAWAPVVNDCVGNLTQAREQMLSYVQFVIDAYEAGNVAQPRVGTKEDAVLAHVNADFLYVGHAPPNLPAAVFGNEGAIGVISQSTTNRELAAAHAAITVPYQAATGDQRGHLYSIYPLTAGCLTGTNLFQNGPCFDIAAHPAITPGKLDPMGKVGICQPVDDGDVLPGNLPALGHRQDGGNTTITAPAGIYPTFCPHDHYAGSWTGGFSDMATRLAWLANKALGVQVAYAANGGLGGLDTDFESPFGAIDLLVFKATFTNDAVGSTPVNPDVGTWNPVTATHPGSITVQSSLADMISQPVVLSQGGGACTNCGGLQLQGNLATAGPLATDGKYRVEWTSVQAAPSVKGAPFILRGTVDEIARVTYSTTPGGNVLSFNGVPFGTWTRNVSQHFEIEVDLTAKTTSLKVDGLQEATGTFTATNFTSISADFTGIDSGVVGWDDIYVKRLSDR